MQPRSAPNPTSPAIIDPRAPSSAAPRLMTFLIGPVATRLDEVGAIVHEALPGQDALACGDAKEALARAGTARLLGWTPLIFVFDYRGARAVELGSQLRRVREAEADAELVVIVDTSDIELWQAALQMAQAPDRLTFLLSPIYRP